MERKGLASGWLIVLALLWLAVLGGAAALAVRALSAPHTPPYYATDQAREGRIVFAQNCAACHGPELEGVSAPALVGDAFQGRWADADVGELFHYVRTQMPPGRGGTLPDAAYARATAYVLARNRFPGGDVPLRVGDPRLDELALDPALADANVEIPDVEGPADPVAPVGVGAGMATPIDPPAGVGGPASPVRALDTTPVYLAQAQEQDDGGDADGGGAQGNGGQEDGAGQEDQDQGGAGQDGAGQDGGAAAEVDGAAVYETHCASCHGAEGGGTVGPALVGNEMLQDAQAVAAQIVHGGGTMPPFGDQLGDAEIAAVATHVRTSWGNDFGPVGPDQVAAVRDGGGQDGGGQDGEEGGDQGGGGQEDGAQGDGGEGAAAQEGGGQDGGGDEDAPQDGGEAPTEGDGGEDGAQEDANGEGDAPQEGADADAATDASGTTDAAALFARSCATCHGEEGEGGVGAALAGNEALQDEGAVVTQIVEGGNGMPAFGGTYDDAQIAALATHVRTAWGNDFGEVSEARVAEARSDDASAGEDGDAGNAGDDGAAGEEAGGDGDAPPADTAQEDDGGAEDAAAGAGDDGADEGGLPDEGAVAAPQEGAADAGRAEGDAAFADALYGRHCAACHAPDGSGGIGPSLVDNPRLQDEAWTVRRILVGANAMPAFGAVLSAEGVAAVTTHVRTAWENDGEPVGVETVEAVASGLTQGQLNPVASVDLASAPLGQQRFMQVCASCHGVQGGGDVGPPLAGNANLGNVQLVLSTIVNGRGIMPAFNHHSDEEIAAIASYVRTSWSNAFGPVAPSEVEGHRPRTDAGGAATGPQGQAGGAQQNGAQQDGSQQDGDGVAEQDGASAPDDGTPQDETPDDETPADGASADDAPADEENP